MSFLWFHSVIVVPMLILNPPPWLSTSLSMCQVGCYGAERQDSSSLAISAPRSLPPRYDTEEAREGLRQQPCPAFPTFAALLMCSK